MSTRLEKRDVRESLAGIGVACVVLVPALAMGTMLRLASERVSIAVCAAIATSLVLAVVAWKGTPRTAASAAIGATLSLGAIVFFGTMWCLLQPLVATHVRCGTADIGLPFFLALVGFVGAALALPASHVARLVPRASLAFAIAFVIAGAVITSFGVRSLARPEPDAYLRLFERHRMDPGTSLVVAGKSVTYDATPRHAPLLGDRKCIVTVGDESAGVFAIDACPSIDVAYDPVASRVLVLKESEPVAIVGMVAGYSPDELGVGDFRGRLGAPRAWVFGALAGLVFALSALAMALRARLRARRADDAVETTHSGGGWITVDGAPRFAPQLATAAPGPIVIASCDASRSPTYRDDGAAKIFNVVPGNRATLRAEAHARMAAWAYVAIASVVTTSLPLWVARMFGIL